MKKSHNPLRLNVGYLYHKPIGTSRDVPFEFEQLQIDDLSIQNLQCTVRLSKNREGLLLQIMAEAAVSTVCVRCLDDIFMPVSTEFEELYQFPSRYREETDLILPEDGYIDLNPLLREFLILALPIKPLCRKACAGLCTVCGANLNESPCDHQEVVETPEESSHLQHQS